MWYVETEFADLRGVSWRVMPERGVFSNQKTPASPLTQARRLAATRRTAVLTLRRGRLRVRIPPCHKHCQRPRQQHNHLRLSRSSRAAIHTIGSSSRRVRLPDPFGDTALMRIVQDPRLNGVLAYAVRLHRRRLWTVGGALARVFGLPAAMESVVVLEDGAKCASERLRLAGVSGLAAEEAAVVAREHGRLLAE
jgi:hypothetical protein